MKTKLHRAITALLFAFCAIVAASAAEKPNVLIILADDLGYGDVRCYSPERGSIPTPHLDALVQQTDLMATLAETLGAKLPDNAGEDSVSLMPLLKGGTAPVREYAISHTSSGLPALRKGAWKIIFGPSGGGFDKTAPADDAPPGQIYDLAADPGETKNLWADKPELVAELTAAMERLAAAHPNDVPVRWRKFLK